MLTHPSERGLSQELIKEMADNKIYGDLTNNRPIAANNKVHREKVLSGFNKIMNFIKRGVEING